MTSASKKGATMTPALRRYLYVTAAISGAAIMIVEILGAKMLSPYLGTSHFVWTAQITVTLLALATGYYVGGILADRSQQLSRLYAAIFASAVYLCFVTFICEPMAFFSLQFDLPIGSLLTSTVLFFVPLTGLAMVGPFLIRVINESLSGVGTTVGRLFGFSTIGSFVGTILMGYVLVPYLPNSVTMYVTAFVLMLMSFLYFWIWGRKGSLAILTVIFGIGTLFGYEGIQKELRKDYRDGVEIDRVNSNFGRLQVIRAKHDGRLFYLNDFITFNDYHPDHKKPLTSFTYIIEELARVYTPKIEKVLCVGLGAGIIPMNFSHWGAQVDIVEINPAVVPVAKKHFGFEPERFQISICDGRYFINRSQKRYDTVILDASLSECAVSHLLTLECFRAIQKTLNPGGTVIINTLGWLKPGQDFLHSSIEQTLGSVFKNVVIHTTTEGNIFFVASDRTPLEMLRPGNLGRAPLPTQKLIAAALSEVKHTDPSHGMILTDDYHPAEFYDAKNRELVRKNLAQVMMRQIQAVQ
jgi:spermidine synthase